MAFRQRFLAGLLWRVALLVASAFAFVAILQLRHAPAATLVSGLFCLGTIVTLWRYVQRTNSDLARFIESVRFNDLSQRFDYGSHGSGFAEVGAALERGLASLREERSGLIDTNRFYAAMVDDAPVALLTVDEQRVELANKAARRLFARHSGTTIEAFADYGSSFTQVLERGPGNGPRLVPLMIDGVPQMAMISGALVERLGGPVHVFAIQPIQSELNAVEVAAQSDLVRVLTHEIMNSMTPVTSLAHSAAALLAQTDAKDGATLAEARMAVERLARRADGVMHFVEGYRQISRKPQVRRRRFELLGWALELEALFRASDAAAGVDFTMAVDPPDLAIDADPDLLSQVLINLLRNGAEAALEGDGLARLSLRFGAARSGATQIEIADNGPGIPAELARDIFLPFFTTKAKGTGVGLSVARQLVIAHGGSIAVEPGPDGGALFRILI